LWRNLDKLMVDAQASGKVNVRDFLDYLTSLNAAGAREGEAAGQAQGSVRLMTIHKAKGLQFPLVVLADASREPRAGSQAAILLPELGLAFRLDPAPMLYRLAKQQDQRQEQAEKQRLLYVALTRAQEKLIINGHLTTRKNGGVTCAGYLSDLVGAAGLELEALVDQAGSGQICPTCSGEQVRAWVLPDQAEVLKLEAVPAVAIAPEPESVPLYPPLELPPEPETDAIETGVRRAPVAVGAMSPVLIGKLVHKAIELWLFPGDPRLTPLLETTALNSNLAQKTQVPAAVQAASELLSRLENHPLRREVEGCPRRFHELPYSRLVNGRAETGYIDLMYLSPAGWQILDFKTDSIRSAQESEELTRRYMQQMRRYTSAVETLLDQKVRTRICFLDDHGEVELVEV
jgi:ATP-dependent helicase/nuclease subunit A